MSTDRPSSHAANAAATEWPISRLNPMVCKLLLAFICLGFLLHTLHYNFIADDAFITFRYTDNLIKGHGLVFNLGDRVEGFTSPLWTLLLAALGSLQLDLLPTARLLGIASGLLAIVLLHQLAAHLCRREDLPAVPLAVAALLASSGSFACWAGSGMETPFFVCLIVAAFLAFYCDRYWLSAVVTLACALTRPEGLLIALLLAFYQGYSAHRKQRPWKGWLLLCVAGVTTLFLGRYLYYGDLLPNTFYAKTGFSWAQIQRGVKYFAEYAADHEGLLLILCPIGIALLWREAGLRLPALGALALWGTTIIVGGDGLPMYRFGLYALPLLLLVQIILLARVYSRFPRWRFSTLLLLLFLTSWVTVHLTPPRVGSHYGAFKFQKDVEVPQWRRIGEWFKEHAAPGESLAAVPAGAVAYYSGLKVYDMLGLTDRHIARRRMPAIGKGWAGHEKHDGPYILRQRPTYLLLGNIDVSPKPRDVSQRPFIAYANSHIFAREQDIYEKGRLFKLYRPRSVELGPEQYLNFYELKEEYRRQ
jgi:arabinofuranosyltransferase